METNYLYKLSPRKLKQFCIAIGLFEMTDNTFIGDKEHYALIREFNYRCCLVDHSVPYLGYVESFRKFINRFGLFYFFRYMTTETIVRVICEHITRNVEVAEKLAEIIYKRGYSKAIIYLHEQKENNNNMKGKN